MEWRQWKESVMSELDMLSRYYSHCEPWERMLVSEIVLGRTKLNREGLFLGEVPDRRRKSKREGLFPWEIPDRRRKSKSLSNRMIEKQVDIQLQQRKLRKLTLSDELKQTALSLQKITLELPLILLEPVNSYKSVNPLLNTAVYTRKQILRELLSLQVLKQRCLRRLAWLKHFLNCQNDTSNSLLLDAGWLEFWEIVLLAAGDVESNPGPNQISDDQLAKVDNRVLGKRDLFVVCDTMFDCRKDWFDLCFALRCSYDDLSAIKKVHAGDLTTCLREGLALWLEGAYDTKQHGPPSWRMLVAAVDNSSGCNNPALALEIAENHKALDAFESSSLTQDVYRDSSHVKKAKEMSIDFGKLYRSLRRELRRVDVEEVKEVVRYSSNPHSLHERCVPPEAYEGATSTKDLLDQLFPTYINPQDTFLLEVIIENCGSRTCKRLLREYTNKYF